MREKTTKNHSILWADDDADDLFIVKEVMDSINDKHQVIEVSNGRQALDYLSAIESQSNLPCLVVLDINMPILNGKETLAIIKSEERFNGIKVIVFTTSNSKKDQLFCEGFGAVMYTKPSSFAGFEKMVSEMLAFCKLPDAQLAEKN